MMKREDDRERKIRKEYNSICKKGDDIICGNVKMDTKKEDNIYMNNFTERKPYNSMAQREKDNQWEELHNSYVNVLYFKKLQLNKKLFAKLKNKNIVIYLKYKESTCTSKNIQVCTAEINNLYLCFLITEPFIKNEKKIIKIYVKYYKDNKYKILSFGFIELNLSNFSEEFYKKKSYMLCYDKSKKKYIFGYFILILANQIKWTICNNRISYEYIKESYFVNKRKEYDQQIFYICKKIQEELLQSFYSKDSSHRRNFHNRALLKHFSVTHSCPSTFSLRRENEHVDSCLLGNVHEVDKVDGVDAHGDQTALGERCEPNWKEKSSHGEVATYQKICKDCKSATHFNRVNKFVNSRNGDNYKKIDSSNDLEKPVFKGNFSKDANQADAEYIQTGQSNFLTNSKDSKDGNSTYSLSSGNANNFSTLNEESLAQQGGLEYSQEGILPKNRYLQDNERDSSDGKASTTSGDKKIHPGKLHKVNIEIDNMKKQDERDILGEQTDDVPYVGQNQNQNQFDLMLCERLQNLLNNDIDHFVEEVQFLLNYLKIKVIKKEKYFMQELKNEYANVAVNDGDVVGKNERPSCINRDGDIGMTRECKDEQSDMVKYDVDSDIVSILENCINTTSLYIRCVLKNKHISNHEKDIFATYNDIINQMKNALGEYVHQSETTQEYRLKDTQMVSEDYAKETDENLVKRVTGTHLKGESNMGKKIIHNNDKETDSFYKHCLINSDVSSCATSSSEMSSSEFSKKKISEHFQVNNYISKNISTALKYYEHKWKRKLSKVRKFF
ncbi:conserved Plasmodium protein, unknown function [Plasmodium ovale wallikeri]|uniref:Uncharacterized protein n=2 Tax=Plasmodium ovale TaxID=36330 RepID=A0A1A8YHK0_PLAOA|nr:conserved Plasmodium protein, unknown function [Plasmodium ovale wallikeri]SBT30746.1 conserved Plasmodium protein, unknown function [Plasmodium ovale wallikeri]SBT75122.1 conserved Plasmodium protein, unknown function [Plasmodium ovale]